MISFLLLVSQAQAFNPPIDWMQPPVACVEELVRTLPSRTCPDFMNVTDPSTDWPMNMPENEREQWRTSWRNDLSYCRSAEIVRRETLSPDPNGSVQREIAWLTYLGRQNSAQKTSWILRSSNLRGVPSQVLYGALMQESILADLGISEDGGNFSCGIGQLNILEWCRWAQDCPSCRREDIGWPSMHDIEDPCSLLTTEMVRPFFNVAIQRLLPLPEYRMRPEHLLNIPESQVIPHFPPASDHVQMLRYDMAKSFVEHCTYGMHGIDGKAFELAHLFQHEVPEGLRDAHRYRDGEHFMRQCQNEEVHGYPPLHPGWLIADAVFNAGPLIPDLVGHYEEISLEESRTQAAWGIVTPVSLIESLYWGGRWNATSGRIMFQNFERENRDISWFKSCVVQRHVARVIQHVALPGITLASSLEGAAGCRQNQPPPEARRMSSGIRRTTVFGNQESDIPLEVRDLFQDSATHDHRIIHF